MSQRKASGMTFLIERKYPGANINSGQDDPDFKTAIPFLLCAYNMRPELVRNFFEKPSAEAVAEARKVFTDITDEMATGFLAKWPEKFIMSDTLKTVLPTEVFKYSEKNANVQDSIKTNIVLVQHGADPTILMVDPRLSFQEQAEYLKAGLPANANMEGYSGFHAAFIGNWEYLTKKIKALLEHGGDPNHVCVQKGMEVGTFLHVVIANEETKCFSEGLALVKDKFDASLVDGENKTILVTAAKVHQEGMVIDIAKTFGTKAMLNHRDESGRTALHYCYAYGMKNAAKELKKSGARDDIPDNDGLTARDYLDKLTKGDVENMLRSIEVHPDRDFKAVRNSITDGMFTPVHVFGKQVLSTQENLHRNANILIADYNLQGKNSMLFKHCFDRFMKDRSSRLVCAPHEAPEASVARECQTAVRKWNGELSIMGGISLIDGIGFMRDEMRKDPSLYAQPDNAPVAPSWGPKFS